VLTPSAGADRDWWAIPRWDLWGDDRDVENLSAAEQLPALYRAILDQVAELERLGQRSAAARFRSDAITTYSRSWDASGRRRLEAILRRTERAIGARRASGQASAQRAATTT